MWHEPRTYRSQIKKEGFISFNVVLQETDLFILADKDYSSVTLTILNKYRYLFNEYILHRNEFKDSLTPISQDPFAPRIIREMIESSRLVGVGPMAAIAGAISQYVANELLQLTSQVIVENGGDNYLKTFDDLIVGLYAGSSRLSNKVNIRIKKEEMPMGICTSSGTIGHSLSLGKADAVCVKSKSAILADAAATAIGNRIKTERDLRDAVLFGMDLTDDILGVVAILGGKIAAGGAIDFC